MSETITNSAEPQLRKTLNTSIQSVRKVRRAYFGALSTVFNTAVDQGETAKGKAAQYYDDMADMGEVVQGQLKTAFTKMPKFVRKATPCGVATTFGVLPKRSAGRIAELEAELENIKAKKIATKSVSKAKKKAAKTKKSSVTNPEIQTKIVKRAKTARPTVIVAPKVSAKTKAQAQAKPARHLAYLMNVRRYDGDASEDVVRKIVNHCGIALRSQDAKYVACSDESERATVRKSWLKRKLGLSASDAELDAKVTTVCEEMKSDSLKCRVTFYYLLAKNENVLSQI